VAFNQGLAPSRGKPRQLVDGKAHAVPKSMPKPCPITCRIYDLTGGAVDAARISAGLDALNANYLRVQHDPVYLKNLTTTRPDRK